MTSETTQAFSHPITRSKATGTASILDRISVRDHVTEVEIGAFQVERGVTQRISFDVVVEVGPSSGADTDDVDDILSYDRVTEAITTEVEAERLNLLETLAERVALRILREPQAMRVFVRIEKLDRGESKLGVEIVRAKVDVSDADSANETPAATVVHLNGAALQSTCLAGWLDQIVAMDTPVILTVANGPAETVADIKAQRHIALLAIEQTAWRLASDDPRCVVVGSWTELDWGLKNGQLSVWAPSKTVLDSADEGMAEESDALTLSKWLAEKLGAVQHLVLDESQNDLDLGQTK